MKGQSRRHRVRNSRMWPGRGIPVAVLFGITALLVTVLAAHSRDNADTSAIAGGEWSSMPPLNVRAGSADPSNVSDRGVVRGLLKLHTDVPPDPRTWVAYLIDGPTSMIRFAARAPYETDIDTRTLPDGQYVIDEVVFRPPARPWVTTSRLRIDNHGPADPGSAPAPPSPSPPPPSPDADPTPSSAAAATQLPVAVPGPATPPRATVPSQPAQAAPPAPAAPAPAGGGMAAQVVELTNAERAKAGCPPLTVDPRLTAAAQAHSADMAAAGYFSHNSQDGRTPFQRVAAAGYTFSVAAENIAAGQRTPQAVTEGWMNSAGHRANILNCSLVHIGVGYATGGSYGTYWTQNFGVP